MANKHETLVSLFNDIADEIRKKDGTSKASDAIVADNFPDRIAAISTDPSGDATAVAGDIRSGKTAYSKGSKITGTVPVKSSADLTVSGATITAPAGIYDSAASKTVATGALSAADSSISGGSFTPTLTYDSTNDNFKFGGSKAASGAAYAKASTAGYVTSSQDTSKSLSATVSATGTVAKVGTGATISGTTTKAPTLTRTAKPSGDTWVDAASGAATTTKPTSGPYVQIDAAASTGTLTATPKVTSAGYGDTTNYGSTAATATVGAAKATTAYVPITTTSASVSGKTVSYGTGWITGGSKSVADGAYSAAGSASITTTPVVTPSISGKITDITTTTAPTSGTDGTDY